MSIKFIIAAAALATLGAPVMAQSGSMQSGAMQSAPGRSDSMHAGAGQPGASAGEMHKATGHRGPTTRQLNRASAAYSRMRASERIRYRMDRRAYMAAVTARHRRAVNKYDRRYARQQMAYANAMAAWRRQVRACHNGNRRACNARSPRVADYY